MLIELIENKSEWKCECTGNNFSKDIVGIRLCISIDNEQISMYANFESDLAIQFPFTYYYYANGIYGENEKLMYCTKCKSYPYRIVKNPLKYKCIALCANCHREAHSHD